MNPNSELYYLPMSPNSNVICYNWKKKTKYLFKTINVFVYKRHMLIDFRERERGVGRGGEREKEIDV